MAIFKGRDSQISDEINARVDSSHFNKLGRNLRGGQSPRRSVETSDISPIQGSGRVPTFSSEILDNEELNPETQVYKKLEEYYHDNFEADEVMKLEKDMRVWNIGYNEQYDLTFIIVGVCQFSLDDQKNKHLDIRDTMA